MSKSGSKTRKDKVMERHARISRAPYRDMLSFFDYMHLPKSLQKFSQPFHKLAHSLVDELPHHPQKMIALQKLLEAKEASVRIAVASTLEQRDAMKLKIAAGYSEGKSVDEILAVIKKQYPDTHLSKDTIEEYIQLLQTEPEG